MNERGDREALRARIKAEAEVRREANRKASALRQIEAEAQRRRDIGAAHSAYRLSEAIKAEEVLRRALARGAGSVGGVDGRE